ncbi:MAG: heparan-alpha-glucosaminide N-acetyltransferase domain-containing protein [Bacteroidota bacterium]
MKTAENRIVSLDIFRGLTIMAMIIVNTPGSWNFAYPILRHSSWNGCTPTDLVFPFFLFAMGFSAVLSITKQLQKGTPKQKLVLQLLRRSAIIFLLGLIVNTFPFTDLGNIRILGVLQRIAIVNLVCGLFLIYSDIKWLWYISASLLLGYWAIMTLIPVPDFGPSNLEPTTNLAAWLDRLVLDKHVWMYTKLYDPEGILSTLPALVSGFIGVLAGSAFMKAKNEQDRLINLLVFGNILIISGMAWDLAFPINKQLWSSSYVLYTSGLAMVVLGICYWIADIRRIRQFAPPFLAFGMNPIIAYFGSEIGAGLLGIIQVTTNSGKVSLYDWLFAQYQSTGLSPMNASLLGALVYTGFWLLVVSVLYRRKIIVKI